MADEASMFSLRSKSKSARIASAATLALAVCALLLAIPVAAMAAPAEGEEPPAPQLAFEPGSYDFGLLEANRSNGETTMQLRNVGAAVAPVYSLEVTGPGSWSFSSSSGDCFSHPLNPGEACSVQVYFHPQDMGLFSAQLRAGSEGGASFTADLSGEGGRPILSAATEPNNFGSVPVGSGGVAKTIDITNKGNLPGGAFIAVISGGAVGSFHLLDENCTGVLLSPAATCNLLVSFDPISTGAKTARLFLVGDGDGGTQITLSGVGLDPEPAPEQPSSPAGAAAPVKALRAHRARSKTRRGGALRRRRRGVAYRTSLR